MNRFATASLTLLRQDWELKLCAGVVAAALWWNVFQTTRDEDRRTVAVRIQLPPSLQGRAAILDPSLQEVEVHLQGPKGALERLAAAEFQVVHEVDSGSVRFGEVISVVLDRDDLVPRPDPGVTVRIPSVLEYRVDAVATEQVPVHPALDVNDDRTYDRVVVRPRVVEVTGPVSVLTRARTARADPGRAPGDGDVRTRTIPGDTLPAGEDWYEMDLVPELMGAPVEIEETQVKVRIRASVPRESSRIEGVPVHLLVPQEFDLGVECAKTVFLVVLKPRGRELRPQDLSLIVDLRDLLGRATGPAEALLEVRLPEGVELESDPPGAIRDARGALRFPVELRRR